MGTEKLNHLPEVILIVNDPKIVVIAQSQSTALLMVSN